MLHVVAACRYVFLFVYWRCCLLLENACCNRFLLLFVRVGWLLVFVFVAVLYCRCVLFVVVDVVWCCWNSLLSLLLLRSFVDCRC